MKSALVTGGAGFIGTWVVGGLLERGWSVRVLDNLSTGSLENIPNEVELITGDICDPKAVEGAVIGRDAVFHLAAFTVVGESMDRAAECCQTNIVGTANVLTAAAEANVDRIIFSSSSAIYPGWIQTPIPEETAPEPENIYAQTKANCESLIKHFVKAQRLQATVFPYFNVYGPGQTAYSAYPSVIPAFLTRVNNDRPLLIHGDGSQTRDFVYVEDVARANIQAAESEGITGDLPVYNIASGVSTSVNELAQMVNRLAGRAEDMVEFDDPVPGDLQDNPASIDRARGGLGWEPETGLEKGLTQTWNSWQTIG
jgi:UDP-glucose 4-epimerase